MAPLRVTAKMQAASAPMNAADVVRYLRGAGAADLSHSVSGVRLAGAGGGNSALRHNKRMHATADTTALMLRQSGEAARDARRYASSYRPVAIRDWQQIW